ncbi:unnamed protein product [Allacma fusca]|uniref:Lipoprotein n=1 Tax=Allacma fusca TaxID=39272 RepID=A0A8J2P8V7_9HEXA|nr:unnamed protein product [Allacma fusca]
MLKILLVTVSLSLACSFATKSEEIKPGWFAEFETHVFDDLSKIKKSLFQTVNMNILDKRIENCATSLSNGNEISARRFWDAIRPQLLPDNELQDLVTRILDKVVLKNETTVTSAINFLGQIEYPRGFEILFNKLKDSSYLYGYSYVFLLAYQYRAACGISVGMFPKLPYIVQDVISSGVELKNVKNRGYLFGNGTENIFTQSSHARSRGRSLGTSSLWVFNATSAGHFTIVNKYKNNLPLLDNYSEFLPELIDDQTFRILVKNMKTPITLLGQSRIQ